MSTPTSQPKLIVTKDVPIVSWFGAAHRILLSAEQTGGHMTLVEGEYPVGSGTPPHVHHNDDEMFEVIAGRFKFMAGDAFLEAGPGEVVWAPRNVPHCFTCIEGPNGVGTMRFTVTPGGADKMFQELATLPAGPPDFAKVAEICGRYSIEFV